MRSCYFSKMSMLTSVNHMTLDAPKIGCRNFVACRAILSISRQSVVVVDVVPSKLKNLVHRAKITIEALIVGCNRGTWATGDNFGEMTI